MGVRLPAAVATVHNLSVGAAVVVGPLPATVVDLLPATGAAAAVVAVVKAVKAVVKAVVKARVV